MAHGVTINEIPTGVAAPVDISAGLPVYVGTSPLVDETAVNKPILCSTLAEFEATFGPQLDDFANWTLHEAAKAHFSVYSVAPIVCINVMDPDDADLTADVTGESHTFPTADEVTLQIYGSPETVGVVQSSIVVKYGGNTMLLGRDYSIAVDDDGFTVITRIDVGGLISAGGTIAVDYTYLDPTGVTAADIIGGYSVGAYTGLEVVEQVYPQLGLVPGFILAPTWSETPSVAARMAVIANSINGAFRAMALCDLSTNQVTIPSYATAGAWKTAQGFTSVDMAACWPLFVNGTDTYHLSTIMACVANTTDHDHDDIPYASPSNKAITGTSAVLDDASEVFLTRPQANILNAAGIVTALYGFAGWKLWGNRTAGHPGTTDAKDAFVPVRRMFNWIANTIILTVDRDVDEPGNRRLIDGVIGTVGSFINGLIAKGALVDGKIEFLASENSTTDLADGKITFHLTLTPPSPAEEISFTVEYDPAALAALFA